MVDTLARPEREGVVTGPSGDRGRSGVYAPCGVSSVAVDGGLDALSDRFALLVTRMLE